ncbi:Levansucrase [Frankliniella fusca]|uniref:Levansucrase n=1 Tax=Frankliniella fusca TaxID=407009 RepID=A0AAE1HSA9_9NEOP|nr:Levansucrase [Frankliniella fusca]
MSPRAVFPFVAGKFRREFSNTFGCGCRGRHLQRGGGVHCSAPNRCRTPSSPSSPCTPPATPTELLPLCTPSPRTPGSVRSRPPQWPAAPAPAPAPAPGGVSGAGSTCPSARPLVPGDAS